MGVTALIDYSGVNGIKCDMLALQHEKTPHGTAILITLLGNCNTNPKKFITLMKL